MPENISKHISFVITALALLCTVALFARMAYKLLRGKYAPVKTVKAQVTDKFVADKFSKIYGAYAKKPRYYVVFTVSNKKRTFSVAEFSYRGYKVGERGTLKYKGGKLIDFH